MGCWDCRCCSNHWFVIFLIKGLKIMFHKVFIEIEVPNGLYCAKVKNICDHYFCDDFGCFCGIFDEELKIDSKFRYKRLPECLKLDEGRICINCGNFGDNWCEFHKEKKLTSDTCEDFVYGSWK
jgi:hypothetical protein